MGKLDHVDPFYMVTNLLLQGRDIVEKWAKVLVIREHDADLGLREQVTLIVVHALFEQALATQDQLARLLEQPSKSPALSVFIDCLECYSANLINLLSVFTENEAAYAQRKRNHSLHGDFTAYYIDVGSVLSIKDGIVTRNSKYNYKETLLTSSIYGIGLSVRAKLIFTASPFWPLLLDGFTRDWLGQVYIDLARAKKQMDNFERPPPPGYMFMACETGVIGPALAGKLPPKALVDYRDSLTVTYDPLIEHVLSGKIEVVDGVVVSREQD